MRDITLCNEGTPKKLKNGLYNFSKLRNLVMMVSLVKDTVIIQYILHVSRVGRECIDRCIQATLTIQFHL